MSVYVEIVKQIEIAERILRISNEDLKNGAGNYEITRRNISEMQWRIKFFTEIKVYIEHKNNEISILEKIRMI
jgi:hypothetical protein